MESIDMKTINVRELRDMSKEQIWNLPEPAYDVIFDDANIIETVQKTKIPHLDILPLPRPCLIIGI